MSWFTGALKIKLSVSKSHRKQERLRCVIAFFVNPHSLRQKLKI